MKKTSVILSSVLIASLMLTGCGEKKNYEKGRELHSDGRYAEASHYFSKANGYKDSDYYLTEYCRTNTIFFAYADAEDYFAVTNGKFVGGGDFTNLVEGSNFAALNQCDDIVALADSDTGIHGLMALRSNGKIVTNLDPNGSDAEEKNEIESWNNIKYIFQDYHLYVGVDEFGRLYSAGMSADDLSEIKDWENIKKIVGDASSNALMGLTYSGEIKLTSKLAEYYNIYEQITDAVDIENGGVVLKRDGTIKLSDPDTPNYNDILNWKNVKDIACNGSVVAAVTYDGKILSNNYEIQKKAEKLKNIVSVDEAGTDKSIIAIDRDGNVYYVSDWSEEKTKKIKDIKMFINKNY